MTAAVPSPTTAPTRRPTVWEELSFLALPDAVADWRKALLYDLAAEAGILAALPATAEALAAELGLDARAVGVVLEALAVWDAVAAGPGPGPAYRPGPAFPDSAAAAVLRHHGRAIRLWSAAVGDRLRGVGPDPARESAPGAVKVMLDGLVVNARESAPGAVDACLALVPGARRVLDVGGGHGEYALEFARRGMAAAMCDRPGVIDLLPRPSPLAQAGVEVFAGDFFEALPEGPFDLVFCAGVTYTYDGAANTELFRRLRPLVAPGGVLAIMTFLGGTDELASLFSVQMLAATGGGGASHGEEDYRSWLGRAGWGDVEVHRLDRRPEWLVVARP